MSKKRIENEFFNRLGNYASIIDDDQLWFEIENRVPQKKRKRRLFIWFTWGMSVLAVGTIIFLMNSKEDMKASEHIAEHNLSHQDKHSFIDEHDSNPSLSSEIKKSSSTAKKKAKIDNAVKPKLEVNTTSDVLAVGENLEFAISSDERMTSLPRADYTDNTGVRNDIEVQKINSIPIREYLPSISETPEITIFKRPKPKKRRVKPIKKKKSFVGMNYYAGIVRSQTKVAALDTRQINVGSDYFSHGLSISYGRFISSGFYGRLIFSLDRSYKKYAEKITRDTLVPSSNGDQIISYTQYSNGVIDTESGIPIVKGTYNRDVLKLNTISTVSIGIGFGYEHKFRRIKVNLEADIQRSFHYSFNGLGREVSEDKIRDLNSFENYFSDAPKYAMNAQLYLDFALNNSFSLIGGIQYQNGMTSILIGETGHEEKLNLIRGILGLKKML